MAEYIEKIGKNQYKTLPDKVSHKKSFPLPRDILARSLGRMSADAFPALQEIIKGSDVIKIREVLDAIGLMVFYNPVLATSENVKPILSLLKYTDKAGTLGMEAQRSLNILEKRNVSTIFSD